MQDRGAGVRGKASGDGRCGRRAELLLLSPSFLTPALDHEGMHVWDTLAIAEFLAEIRPKAGFCRGPRRAQPHRSVSGEMHSGFANLRSALPMNIKAEFPEFPHLVRRQARHRADHPDFPRVSAALRRTVPVRRRSHPRRRHVRPGLLALRHLSCPARFRRGRLPRPHSGWAPMVEWAEAARVEPDETGRTGRRVLIGHRLARRRTFAFLLEQDFRPRTGGLALETRLSGVANN